MKSHQEAAILMDYCSGRLAENAAHDLELHLAACAACAEWVASQKALWSVLNEWQAPPASTGFDRSLERRLWQAGEPSWIDRLGAALWPGSPALGRPALAVATLCLVMVASLLLQNPRTQPPPESQVRTEKIEAEQVERTLDDMQMLRELGLASKPETATSKTL